jgi:hypothetical protein
MDDMVNRGLYVSQPGETNGMCRLTEAVVAEIKHFALEGILSQWEIAELYGMGQGHVSRIKLGQRWPWIEPKAPTSPRSRSFPVAVQSLTPGFRRRF